MFGQTKRGRQHLRSKTSTTLLSSSVIVPESFTDYRSRQPACPFGAHCLIIVGFPEVPGHSVHLPERFARSNHLISLACTFGDPVSWLQLPLPGPGILSRTAHQHYPIMQPLYDYQHCRATGIWRLNNVPFGLFDRGFNRNILPILIFESKGTLIFQSFARHHLAIHETVIDTNPNGCKDGRAAECIVG